MVITVVRLVILSKTDLNPGKEVMPPTTRIFLLRSLRQSDEHYRRETQSQIVILCSVMHDHSRYCLW